MSDAAFQERLEELRRRVDIVRVVGAVVKLRGGARPRGQCPFHGSKSDSLALYPDSGTVKCWGCDFQGDAIKFVQEFYGVPFLEAVQRLEDENGLQGMTAAPLHRDKQVRPRSQPQTEPVDSLSMGRFIWKGASRQPEVIRTYLRARGVPEQLLGDERLTDVRLHGLAPCSAWPLRLVDGKLQFEPPPAYWPKAPAMVALVRRPPEWLPIGVHVTWLAPDLKAKMGRRRGDGVMMPARKMLGEALGGCVVLGRLEPGCALYVGEGIETVLSGMAMAGAGTDACGLAALSLDNLEGHWRKWKNGVTPLYDIRPDPERSPALAFAHDGPVIGLIDADMAPLHGPQDRATGERRGVPIVDYRGGPIVRRALTTAERATICGELFVQAWRAAGCHQVKALRPRMGLDCNDAVREREAVEV